MRLVILGASGGCGAELVQQAHGRGHEVVAVARASSTLEVPTGVSLERGSLDDTAFLTRVMQGADVLLSAVGLRLRGFAPWSQPEDETLLSRTVPQWIAAMSAAGVERVMAISAGGVGESRSEMPWVFRFVIWGSALRYAYAELDIMETLLARSGLDWCCPRPTGLSDGRATGEVKVDPRLVGYAQISRADVAGWMLDELERPRFDRRAPILTVTGAA